MESVKLQVKWKIKEKEDLSPEDMAAILDKAINVISKNSWSKSKSNNNQNWSNNNQGYNNSQQQQQQPLKIYVFETWWILNPPIVAHNIGDAMTFLADSTAKFVYAEPYTESPNVSHKWLNPPFYY